MVQDFVHPQEASCLDSLARNRWKSTGSDGFFFVYAIRLPGKPIYFTCRTPMPGLLLFGCGTKQQPNGHSSDRLESDS